MLEAHERMRQLAPMRSCLDHRASSMLDELDEQKGPEGQSYFDKAPRWLLYYFDPRTMTYVPASAPEAATLQRVVSVMSELLLPMPDKSFVGLVDRWGVAMQFCGRPQGLVLMEIVCAERGGSFGVELQLEECCARVQRLEERISISDYPDLQFVLWGGAPAASA